MKNERDLRASTVMPSSHSLVGSKANSKSIPTSMVRVDFQKR